MTELSKAEEQAAAVFHRVLAYVVNRDGTYRLLRDELMEALVRAYTISDDGYEVARFLDRSGIRPDGELVAILHLANEHEPSERKETLRKLQTFRDSKVDEHCKISDNIS